MNRAGTFLLILFIAQLILTAVIYLDGNDRQSRSAEDALIDVGTYAVDELKIDDSMGNSVVLRKSGDLWLLPELGNLPAQPEMIAKVLQTLTTDDPGLSIAHTIASRQRFQVAHYHYRLKIGLSSLNQPVGTIFLGTSPGFRKVHVRNEKQDNIYSVDLNLYDIPLQPGKWLEPRLLQVRAPVQITADGYSLERSGGEWRLGTGQKPDQRELQALLGALRNIQVQGVATKEAEKKAKKREPELILQVQGLAAQTELQLYKIDQAHFVRSSEYPLLFRVSAYDFDKLTGIDSFLLSGAQ
ncbi:MAG: DUF4340 domain-containing protein [Halioglobus sp.]